MRVAASGFAACMAQAFYIGHQYRRNKLEVQSRSWFGIFGNRSPESTQTGNLTSNARIVNSNLTLYQYATCPFCNKVRAYLDFYGIPYFTVEVKPIPKTEMKWLKGLTHKVPTIRISGESGQEDVVLQESAIIVSLLHSYQMDSEGKESFASLKEHYEAITKDAEDKNAKYTIKYYALDNDPKFKSELKWRKWADEVLVHVIAPNIYRSYGEALSSFSVITSKGNFGYDNWWAPLYSLCATVLGATMLRFVIAPKLKKKYSLKADVRQSLYESVNEWTSELGDRKYHGGEEPDLADLAVFGVLRSMEDMSAFLDMLERTKISKWYGRMTKVCQNNSKAILPSPTQT